jgi:hypothetical protein
MSSPVKLFVFGLEILNETECETKCNKIFLEKTKKIYKGHKKILKNSEECCNICLENLRVGEYKRTLPCNHEFHKKCVDKWMKIYNNCPMCRKEC